MAIYPMLDIFSNIWCRSLLTPANLGLVNQKVKGSGAFCPLTVSKRRTIGAWFSPDGEVLLQALVDGIAQRRADVSLCLPPGANVVINRFRTYC
jgi:hypothetical protein